MWQEFRKTLISRTTNDRTLVLATHRPQEFFNARNLRTQYDFFRSLPNLFVGLGLLGTFIGLIAALTFSTQDLAIADNQDKIKTALSGLLTTAAAKFYISAAGLIASLILSLSTKTVLKYLHDLVLHINNSIEERLLFLTDQSLAEGQLTVQQESLLELRLFNSNVAMKIGDAVRNAIQTSNDGISHKLEQVADKFATLVGSSGEGATKVVGDAMKNALEGTLQEASTAIAEVSKKLEALPQQLSEAANAIRSSGQAANEHQRQLADSLQQGLQNMLQTAGAQLVDGLRDGATAAMSGLKVTSESFGASATQLGGFLTEFSENGQSYMDALKSIVAQSERTEAGLREISAQIASATGNLTRASSVIDAHVEQLLSGIRDFTRGAEESSRTHREAQQAIRGSVETLQQQMSRHIQRFDNVDEKLATVFNSIASHLELQSKQMHERLTTMDQALATAVNQFEVLIDDLTAAVRDRHSAVAAE